MTNISPEITEPPFFIVGCGRSGTTLLRSMLNQHTRLAIPFESLFMLDYLRASENVSIEVMKHILLRDHEFNIWKMNLRLEDLNGIESAKELMDRIHSIYLRKTGKERWGQKTPRFVRFWPLLKSHYPGAKFIIVLRDPHAVASSLIRSRLHRSNILFAARRWVMDVEFGLELKDRYPDDVMEIRFEDLIRHTENTLRGVCTFLGEQFEPGLLTYYNTGTQEYNAFVSGIISNINRPPSVDRLEAWRDHLTGKQIHLLEYVANRTMEKVGYDIEMPLEPPTQIYITSLKIQRYFGLIRQSIQRITHYTRPFISFFYRKLRLGLLKDDLKFIKL